MYRYSILIFLFSLSLDAHSAATSTTAVEDRIKAIQSANSNRADRQFWRTELKWSDDCESSFNYPESVSGLGIYPVQGNEYLLRVTCTFGSYQGRHQLYVLTISDKVQARALELPQYKIEAGKTVIKEPGPLFWGEILTDSNPSAMKILNLHSGAGHCGVLTTYKLAGGKLIATRLKAQPNCESKKKERDPENWQEYKLQ